MRTIPEFAAACREHDRHLRRLLVCMLVWWGLGVVAIGPFVERIKSRLADSLGEPGGVIATITLWLTAMFVPVLLLGWWVERRMKRIPGASCPECGKSVVHPGARQRTVATRGCPFCRARLLADPDPAPDVPLRSMDKVEAVDRAGFRRAAGWLAIGFVAWIAGAGVYAVLTETVGGGRKKGLFAEATDDPYTAALLDLAAILVLGFVPFLLGTGRFLVLYRRAERRPEVRCPHCDGRLLVGLARETGNCGHCGRLAVSRMEGSGRMAGEHLGGPP